MDIFLIRIFFIFFQTKKKKKNSLTAIQILRQIKNYISFVFSLFLKSRLPCDLSSKLRK